MQYGGLLAVRNRRVSILQSNPLWGPRQNLMVPVGMIFTMLIAVVNLYGPGLQDVFATVPIPGMFWGLPFTFALGILVMDELRKLIVRTYPKVSNIRDICRTSLIKHTSVYHCAHGVVGASGHVVLFYRVISYSFERIDLCDVLHCFSKDLGE